MKHLAMLAFDEALFNAMADICRLDPAFAKSWTEWNQLIEQANREASEAGDHLEALRVRPTTFKCWCEHVGFVPGLDALKAYALAARTPVIQLGENLPDSAS